MKKPAWLLVAVFALIGILYNSWPLGYIVDKSTARYGLASDLELPGHPYAWIFVACDVICGIMLVLVAGYLFAHKKFLRAKINPVYWSTLATGLVLFGFFTGFGASAPDNCPHLGVSVCVNVNGRLLSVDVLETTIAALGLLIAMFACALISLELKNKHLKLANIQVFILWCASGIWLSYDLLTNTNMHNSQQYFLSMCGLALLFIGIIAANSIKGLISPRRTLQRTVKGSTSSK
jgi:hypothetical protein